MEGPGEARQGVDGRRGEERRILLRRGPAGQDRRGKAGSGEARTAGQERQGGSWGGWARRGAARQVLAGRVQFR